MILVRGFAALLIAVAISPCAAAQDKESLPIAAVDARVAFPKLQEHADGGDSARRGFK